MQINDHNMKLKTFLFDDESGVSPVIGVILMVAITVILAAVIATFVLGLGEQISDTAPSATFTYDFDDSVNPNTLTVTHNGGQSLSSSNLKVNVNGTQITNAGGDYGYDTNWPSDVSAGGSAVLQGIQQDDDVEIIWSSPDGDQSAILSEW
ncbi:hypothetical protein HLRTI_002828 [Halorhabdus tiamatea SARL4B]|nr:type IV pilin N-terminal domain-containing protein [Halorhabdus tiamatea]ERJ05200.1 hypothetical protein HLRTI_002828 [Halorhabdus tiamatea SARL4B]